jgi:hypothetical protein
MDQKVTLHNVISEVRYKVSYIGSLKQAFVRHVYFAETIIYKKML